MYGLTFDAGETGETNQLKSAKFVERLRRSLHNHRPSHWLKMGRFFRAFHTTAELV